MEQQRRRADELADVTAALELLQAALSVALALVMLDRVSGGELGRRVRRWLEPRPAARVEENPVYGVAREADRIAREAAKG